MVSVSGEHPRAGLLHWFHDPLWLEAVGFTGWVSRFLCTLMGGILGLVGCIVLLPRSCFKPNAKHTQKQKQMNTAKNKNTRAQKWITAVLNSPRLKDIPNGLIRFYS